MKKGVKYRTNKIKIALLMTIFFILIIILNSGLSYKTCALQDKSDTRFSERREGQQQKETKYQYLGAEKCASVCHNNEKMGFQYEIWKTSPHSDAFKSLASDKAERYARKAHISENPQVSQACLKCHITGGDLDPSFLTVTYKKEDGVTCEACHKHKYVAQTYLPNEADCLNCHNDSLHKMHKFDFREKSAKIAHSRPTGIVN